jgi:hypothetical protein
MFAHKRLKDWAFSQQIKHQQRGELLSMHIKDLHKIKFFDDTHKQEEYSYYIAFIEWCGVIQCQA